MYRGIGILPPRKSRPREYITLCSVYHSVRSKSKIKTFTPLRVLFFPLAQNHKEQDLWDSKHSYFEREYLIYKTWTVALFISVIQPIAACFKSGFSQPWSYLLLGIPKADPKFCLLIFSRQRRFEVSCQTTIVMRPDIADSPDEWKLLTSPLPQPLWVIMSHSKT